MSIVRVSKRERFVVMDKTGLEDDRLTFRAKGLLAYLLAKPDNWTINYRQLEKVGPDGKSIVLKSLRELELAGYLKRERRHVGGRYDWIQTLYETPNAPKSGALSGPENNAPYFGTLTEEGSNEIGNAPKTEPHYLICEFCSCAVLARDFTAHTQTHEEVAS